MSATNDKTRWDDMKVIVNDKGLPRGKGLKKSSAMNESANCDNEDEPIGRIDGKYDFIMMVGDGNVYGFEGERIHFHALGDQHKPIGFQWKPAKNREVDFNWLPLDDEEDWVPYDDYDDDEERYNDDGFDYREWM